MLTAWQPFATMARSLPRRRVRPQAGQRRRHRSRADAAGSRTDRGRTRRWPLHL